MKKLVILVLSLSSVNSFANECNTKSLFKKEINGLLENPNAVESLRWQSMEDSEELSDGSVSTLRTVYIYTANPQANGAPAAGYLIIDNVTCAVADSVRMPLGQKAARLNH